MKKLSSIKQYQIIDIVHESNRSLIYRAIRKKDNLPVILKILKQDHPSIEELARYKQEYEIIRTLNTNNAIKAYFLEEYSNSLMIVLEDFGGKSLNKYLVEQNFTIKTFFELAIKITEGLKVIHENNIIHKDINPSNILLNLESKDVKLIDFGISTLFPKEKILIKNTNFLEGTLPYISPEQTGKINTFLDYRTDFYSLGVTFYELLTQELPFKTNNPIELVYSHLARSPKTPHEINPAIPKPLSNLVTKLMNKNKKKRYQSAWGLKNDLIECQYQFLAKGKISFFQLGQRDIFNYFQISDKLYGREKELDQLLKLFRSNISRPTQVNTRFGLFRNWKIYINTRNVQTRCKSEQLLHFWKI